MKISDTVKIRWLIKVAEVADEESARMAMKKLREIDPSYHWCYVWDGMVICDKDPEADCCTCDE